MFPIIYIVKIRSAINAFVPVLVQMVCRKPLQLVKQNGEPGIALLKETIYHKELKMTFGWEGVLFCSVNL